LSRPPRTGRRRILPRPGSGTGRAVFPGILSPGAREGNTAPVIQGGNATIYVSDMQRSVDFYTGVLGLRLIYRVDDHWAQLDAGGLAIALHPASDRSPAAGTPGGITVGLSVDVPIVEAIAALAASGVEVHGPAPGGGGVVLAFFADPDGNPLYLAEKPH
jgi:catechol 2,3-dioxygenase-like lactoylglutathione lyase family enzyme